MDTSNEPKPTEPAMTATAPIVNVSAPSPTDVTMGPDFSSSGDVTMPSPSQTISPEGPAAAPVMPPSEGPEAPAMPATGEPGQGAPTVHNPMAAQPQGVGAPKKKKPILVIIVAILIALILAGAALVAMNNSKKKTTTIPVVGVVIVGATSTDVTDATKELDAAVASAKDSVDFGISDLLDTALGL